MIASICKEEMWPLPWQMSNNDKLLYLNGFLDKTNGSTKKPGLPTDILINYSEFERQSKGVWMQSSD